MSARELRDVATRRTLIATVQEPAGNVVRVHLRVTAALTVHATRLIRAYESLGGRHDASSSGDAPSDVTGLSRTVSLSISAQHMTGCTMYASSDYRVFRVMALMNFSQSRDMNTHTYMDN